MKEVQTNQSTELKWSELNEQERQVVHLFRQLDKKHKEDILRFLNVFLGLD